MGQDAGKSENHSVSPEGDPVTRIASRTGHPMPEAESSLDRLAAHARPLRADACDDNPEDDDV